MEVQVSREGRMPGVTVGNASNAWSNYRAAGRYKCRGKHDCMDAGGRATQEQLPRTLGATGGNAKGL